MTIDLRTNNWRKTLQILDEQNQTGGNRIFYLALPPSLYQPVTRQIGQAGLAKKMPMAAVGRAWWLKSRLAGISKPPLN